MNTRVTFFDSPLFLGFDHFEKTFDRLRKSGNEGYPPYNIEQIGDNGLRITLAVAGFSMDDLDVEIEHNQLTVRGKQSDEDDDRIFLHRGIAGRQFQRSFVLADGIEIKDAELNNGLLHINLIRLIPESTAQKIRIKSGSVSDNAPKAIDYKPDSTSDSRTKDT
ncbi:MAG: heat-shock protein Hsp20 [Micavibrio sp.]|nr:heat-shock protein Hsp20 [Micavibrio sp.]|tara:strand:+ start:138 stop:629 length:492 start_codon:yes stop_codon:yes gene_type:complete